MKLPSKITPDYLKDTIVAIHFVPNISMSVLGGLIYSELKTLYTLPKASAQNSFFEIGLSNSFSIKQGVNLQLEDDFMKIQLINNSLVFNTINSYNGWTSFSAAIFKVVEILIQKGLLEKINRLGIRYISEFPNIEIFERLNLSLSLSLSEKSIQSTTLRSEIKGTDYTAILNLANQINVPNHLKKDIEFVSLMDIDVFSTNFELNDVTQVKEKLNYLHRVEKEIFFGLLKEDFLKSLNPEY